MNDREIVPSNCRECLGWLTRPTALGRSSPGRITPGSRTVQLKVGTSGIYDYSLAMPKSPTPLDLFFLIDTSGSMSSSWCSR